MSSRLIIGLGYKKRAGKDSVANRLVDKHGFYKVSFADSLRNAAEAIFGFTDEQLTGDLKEVVDPYWKTTPRELLQKMGTDALRDVIDPDIWIKSAFKKIQDRGYQKVVIPDVRFPNEAAWVKSQGGMVCLVNRPEVETNQFSTHASETSMDGYKDWDLRIENDSTLARLYEKADYLMKIAEAKKSQKKDSYGQR